MARPIHLFYRTFKAPIKFLDRSGTMVIRALGMHSTAEHTAAYTEEELRQLVGLSHKSGHLIEDERQLIYNVFDFTEATVESVMVPRTEIEAASTSSRISSSTIRGSVAIRPSSTTGPEFKSTGPESECVR